MVKLHRVISDVLELIIISNQYTSIERVVMKIFRNANRNICFHHVKGNVKSKLKMLKALYDKFELAFINIKKKRIWMML